MLGYRISLKKNERPGHVHMGGGYGGLGWGWDTVDIHCSND